MAGHDQYGGVVGVVGTVPLELTLGFLERRDSEGLAAGGQHGHVVAAQRDGPREVVQRRLEPVQFEVHHGPVRHRLGKPGSSPEPEVVGIAGGVRRPGAAPARARD